MCDDYLLQCVSIFEADNFVKLFLTLTKQSSTTKLQNLTKLAASNIDTNGHQIITCQMFARFLK